MKRVRMSIGVLLVSLLVAVLFAVPVSASGELVALEDEPALCGSEVARLRAYNSAISRPCVVATAANTFLATDVARNQDIRCHVDLSANRIQGLRDVDEAVAFPDLSWHDFCVDVIVDSLPVVTPTPTPTPVDATPQTIVCPEGTVAIVVSGVPACTSSGAGQPAVAVPAFTG